MKMVEMLAVALLLVWCGQALWAAEEGPTSAPVSEPGLKGRSDIVFFEELLHVLELPRTHEVFIQPEALLLLVLL